MRPTEWSNEGSSEERARARVNRSEGQRRLSESNVAETPGWGRPEDDDAATPRSAAVSRLVDSPAAEPGLGAPSPAPTAEIPAEPMGPALGSTSLPREAGEPPASPAGAPWGWAPPPVVKPGVIPLRPLGVGEILDGAVTTIRRNPAPMLGLSAIVAVITSCSGLRSATSCSRTSRTSSRCRRRPAQRRSSMPSRASSAPP